MKTVEAMRILEELSAAQWGMVTTAQASALGVSRLVLSRLADSGHLERLTQGVYRNSGAPSDPFEDLRAAWLSTEPALSAEERLGSLSDGVVVASVSAAWLHDIGDLWADRHEFVSPKRRQTQRAEIRYRRRELDFADVTLVDGLPVMTLERTLADLLDDVREMSLVADALGAAARKRRLDLRRLRTLFAPLAERNGFRRQDGAAVLEHLLVLAGLDIDAVAQRISGQSELSTRILQLLTKSVEIPGEMTQAFAGLRQIADHVAQLEKEISPVRVEGLREALETMAKVSEELRASADAYSAGFGERAAEALGSVAIAKAADHWTKMLPTFDFNSASYRPSREKRKDHE